MLVPLVDATVVPLTIGANVSVTATNVCVDEPATVGADSVTEPLVSPEITTEAMIYPYLKIAMPFSGWSPAVAENPVRI